MDLTKTNRGLAALGITAVVCLALPALAVAAPQAKAAGVG